MNESKSYSINYDPGREYMIERPNQGQGIRLNESEIDALLELLERLEPSFICEEMMNDEKEEEVCANYCEYASPISECFVRYVKMKTRE